MHYVLNDVPHKTGGTQKTGILFVYASHVYWKIGKYQNVTLENFLSRSATNNKGHIIPHSAIPHADEFNRVFP